MTENAYFDKTLGKKCPILGKLVVLWQSSGKQGCFDFIISVFSRGKKTPKFDSHCQIFKKVS